MNLTSDFELVMIRVGDTWSMTEEWMNRLKEGSGEFGRTYFSQIKVAPMICCIFKDVKNGFDGIVVCCCQFTTREKLRLELTSRHWVCLLETAQRQTRLGTDTHQSSMGN